VTGLTGRYYGRKLAQRHPACLLPCALIGAGDCQHGMILDRGAGLPANGWDHCHVHGIIRGALCTAHNRRMADVDNGVWCSRRIVEWADVPYASAYRAYRTRCPGCTDECPHLSCATAELWHRGKVRDELREQGVRPGCTNCPVLESAHGLPLNTARQLHRPDIAALNAGTFNRDTSRDNSAPPMTPVIVRRGEVHARPRGDKHGPALCGATLTISHRVARMAVLVTCPDCRARLAEAAGERRQTELMARYKRKR